MGRSSKANNRSAGRKQNKTSCLVKKQSSHGREKGAAAGVGKARTLLVPTKTQTLKLGSKRPGTVRSGPSAQKLALKARRRQEEEEAAAARGRELGAAYSVDRAMLKPEEVVIAPASFSVEPSKEDGDMQWLFDASAAAAARDARKGPRQARAGAAAPKQRQEQENSFAALDEEEPPAGPVAPAAQAAPAFLSFAPASFSLAPAVVPGTTSGGDFQDI